MLYSGVWRVGGALQNVQHPPKRVECPKIRRVGRSLLQLVAEVVGLLLLGGGHGGALLGRGGGHHDDGRVGGPGHLAVVEDDGAAHHVVRHVEVVVVLVPGHGEQQLRDVVREEGGGLSGEAGGQVRVADVGHVVVDGALPGGDRLDVAASLGGEVHHHAAQLHVVHHVLLDEDWHLPFVQLDRLEEAGVAALLEDVLDTLELVQHPGLGVRAAGAVARVPALPLLGLGRDHRAGGLRGLGAGPQRPDLLLLSHCHQRASPDPRS